jgi:hypothetical protein
MNGEDTSVLASRAIAGKSFTVSQVFAGQRIDRKAVGHQEQRITVGGAL